MTQDNPLSYPVKLPKREAEAGKQFSTAPTKTGKYPTSYFDPAHKWVMDGVTYVDTQRYAVRSFSMSGRTTLGSYEQTHEARTRVPRVLAGGAT